MSDNYEDDDFYEFDTCRTCNKNYHIEALVYRKNGTTICTVCLLKTKIENQYARRDPEENNGKK